MIRTLTRIYKETRNETYLDNAIKKRWITEAEKAEIMSYIE